MDGECAVLAVVGAAQRFAIDSNEGTVGLLINGVGPTNEGSLELRWLDARNEPGDGVVNWNAILKKTLD